MAYDIFVLVWGERFVREFAEIAVPFQLTVGNLPALAAGEDVHYHIYTDRTSRGDFGEVPKRLGQFADVQFHYFDEIFVGGRSVNDLIDEASGSEVKYQTQQYCFSNLLEQLGADQSRAIIILDPNFVVADGAFAALDARRRAGARAVTVNALRLSRSKCLEDLADAAGSGRLSAPRDMVAWALPRLHNMVLSSFTDAPAFSPYPSQIYWRVDDAGICGRCFIPHPLMVTNTPALRNFRSTLDYDAVLRTCADHEIAAIGDSDEILVTKFSNDAHAEERVDGPTPTAENLALFCLTSTHHRHRLFADLPLKFHSKDMGPTWNEVEEQVLQIISQTYSEVDRILAQSGRLDARFMMHVKSYSGPIEDFTSPQMEPAALAAMAQTEQRGIAAI